MLTWLRRQKEERRIGNVVVDVLFEGKVNDLDLGDNISTRKNGRAIIDSLEKDKVRG
jgi:hypothetical protein